MMGEGIISFYRDNIKRTWKTAFYSAVVIGFLVHLYKFTNLLPNWDALYNFYSSQNMVASGRWFLSVACGLSSFFDLPWFIGLLSLVFMGLTAAAVAEVFEMKNPVLICLSSGLLVTFPAVTATLSYEFTADGYMLAMLLAAISVCLSRMDYIGKKHWPRLVASGVCICLACGIYQAYVSFAFVLAVCYFMMELLENRREEKRLWQWIGIQILIYAFALAAYYGIWKLCLYAQGIEASTYQGINGVGVMSGADLMASVGKVIKSFALFFLEWDVLHYGFTVYSALNTLFLLCFALGMLAVMWKRGCFRRPVHLVLMALCGISLPFGCYIWYLTSPSVWYHALMLQSVCVLYIFTAVIFDRWIRPRASNLALLILTAVVFNNSVAANICYNYMEQSFETTKAAAVEISTRIHLLDDGTVKYVAFCGGLEDWSQKDHFRWDGLRQLGGWKNLNKNLMAPVFFHTYLDFELSYYRINGLENPVAPTHPLIPAPQGWHFRFPLLGDEESSALFETEEVKDMPSWPAADSIVRMGDTVVVKLSEPDPYA